MLVVQRIPVFIRAALSFFASRLLDARSNWHNGLGRRRTHPLGHQLHQQRLLGRHPLHLVVEHRVDTRPGHAMDIARLAVADPKLDGLGSEIHKRKPLPVSRPSWLARARALCKRDMRLCPIGDVHQVEALTTLCNAVTARGVVLAVILWLDPHPRKAQKRRRHPGNRRVDLHIHQQNRVLCRTHSRIGREWRVHHI